MTFAEYQPHSFTMIFVSRNYHPQFLARKIVNQRNVVFLSQVTQSVISRVGIPVPKTTVSAPLHAALPPPPPGS